MTSMDSVLNLPDDVRMLDVLRSAMDRADDVRISGRVPLPRTGGAPMRSAAIDWGGGGSLSIAEGASGGSNCASSQLDSDAQ